MLKAPDTAIKMTIFRMVYRADSCRIPPVVWFALLIGPYGSRAERLALLIGSYEVTCARLASTWPDHVSPDKLLCWESDTLITVFQWGFIIPLSASVSLFLIATHSNMQQIRSLIWAPLSYTRCYVAISEFVREIKWYILLLCILRVSGGINYNLSS